MNAYWVQNTEKWTKNEQQREGGLICSFPTFAYPLKTSESLTANKQIPEDKWFGQNEKETKKRKMAGWSGGEERERELKIDNFERTHFSMCMPTCLTSDNRILVYTLLVHIYTAFLLHIHSGDRVRVSPFKIITSLSGTLPWYWEICKRSFQYPLKSDLFILIPTNVHRTQLSTSLSLAILFYVFRIIVNMADVRINIFITIIVYYWFILLTIVIITKQHQQ